MTEYNLQPIYIVGPTGSGKSHLAIKLASVIDSVIISADSMQIYRGLDIGTAKESMENRNKLHHEMLDVVNYDEEYSVAEWAEQAKIHIDNALKNGKLPIVVGGTGLYFEALLYPFRFGNTTKNPELRKQLENELEEHGAQWIHDKLEALDPKSAEKLHVNDTKRVMRALEIVITTGKTREENSDNIKEPNVIMIGLNTDRAVLYDKINKRVDQMIEDGLVNEVLSVGNFNYQSMQAIGYKEFKDCNYQKVDGKYIIEENELNSIIDKIKQDSRNYAKRQLTWLRKYKFINWFDCKDQDSAVDFILKKLEK